jgi:uncharacterized protein with von Willebrand factor type A (vWA) domain
MAKNQEVSTTVLEHYGMDQVIFDSVSELPKIDEMIGGAEGDRRPLVQDVFGSLYKLNPKVGETPNQNLKPLVENLLSMPEYRELCNSTRLDDISSAIGTMQLAPALLEQLAEIEKQKEEGQSTQQFIDQMSDAQKAGMRQQIRGAIEQAQQDADKLEDGLAGWGVAKGDLQNYPTAKKFELADTLLRSNKLQRVTDLMGRMRNLLKGLDAVKYSHGADEIVDITTGNDLAHLLPTEFLKLQTTPMLFFKDYMEHNLLQYNLKGVEPQGKGPIIVCLDVSMSMQENMGGATREEWAKAMSLALIALAEKQKRAFALVTFEGRVVSSENFGTTKLSLEQKMKIAAIAAKGGGTDFLCALVRAFEIRLESPEMKPADIVFITDGEYQFKNEENLKEVLRVKKELDVRVFGIAVGEQSRTLDSFCDQVCRVTNSGDIETVQQVLKATAAEAKN